MFQYIMILPGNMTVILIEEFVIKFVIKLLSNHKQSTLNKLSYKTNRSQYAMPLILFNTFNTTIIQIILGMAKTMGPLEDRMSLE